MRGGWLILVLITIILAILLFFALDTLIP